MSSSTHEASLYDDEEWYDELGEVDWYQAHLNAIDSVNRDICIKEYRRCGVPLTNDLLRSEVEEK